MGKNLALRKLYHRSATFSLFWSLFYALRVGVYFLTVRNRTINEAIEQQVIQAMLAVMGICVSLSMYNAYKKEGSMFVAASWFTWCFANFVLSLSLVHMCIFSILGKDRPDRIRFLNEIFDLVHIVNGVATIYFIIIFAATSARESSDVVNVPFDAKRIGFDGEETQEGIDYDDIVYFV